jgi:phospholipase C
MLAGCGGSGAPLLTPDGAPAIRTARPANSSPAISNVIVVVQRWRSFDNLFAGYPGADAPTSGLTSDGKSVPLQSISFKNRPECTRGDDDTYFKTAYDGGKMDGWNLLDANDPRCPYTHVSRPETAPYWKLAHRYAIADRMFASTHFDQDVQGLYLIAGTTKIARNTYDIAQPNDEPFGCDAPPGTKTSILKNGRIEVFGGPFPCFTQFPTIANLLDNAGVAWKYYEGTYGDRYSGNSFDAISYVRNGSDWNDDIAAAKDFFSDVKQKTLRPVSWVISPLPVSDSPGGAGGPKWIDSIVATVKTSSYWPHAAIVVVWENPGDGNFYDDVTPPQLDPMGLGFRVPLILVSPRAKQGYVSHVQYEFGSIIRFIEENWNLGSLDATDARANDITDMFE